jgi:hypothetical protein
MLVRSLGYANTMSFNDEFLKGSDPVVALIGEHAIFPLNGIGENDEINRYVMAQLLYNYLYSNRRTVSWRPGPEGFQVAVDVFTPVLSSFGFRRTIGYVTGILDWAMEGFRVPIPGYIGAERSWLPIPLHGDTLSPDPNNINIIDNDHNVMIAWVDVRPRAARDTDASFNASKRLLDDGMVAEALWNTYNLKDILSAEDFAKFADPANDKRGEVDEILALNLLGLKVQIDTDTKAGKSEITTRILGQVYDVSPNAEIVANRTTAEKTLNLDNGAVRSGFELPYPVTSLAANRRQANRQAMMATDSLYIFDNTYMGNKLRPAHVAAGTARLQTDNLHWQDLVNRSNNGLKYTLHLVHNGEFGNDIATSQEFFYVYRPWSVGVRVNDATHANGAGVRFTTSVTAGAGAQAGDDRGAGATDNNDRTLRTGVAWAAADKTALAEADREDELGEAYFYELRGLGAGGTRHLIVHEKLTSEISGELVRALDKTAWFLGGDRASVTFNENVTGTIVGSARKALADAVPPEDIAGTGGDLGLSQRGFTYKLYSSDGRYVLARVESERPGAPGVKNSEYAVVLEESTSWPFPLHTAAGVPAGVAGFVRVMRDNGVTERILVYSINGNIAGQNGVPGASAPNALSPGDRIRLVSTTFGAWNVIRLTNANDTTGDGLTTPTTPNMRTTDPNAPIPGTTRFIEPTLEYSFYVANPVKANISTGATRIVMTSASPELAPNRAIIGNDTKLVVFTSNGDVAAVTTGNAVTTATFLESFLPTSTNASHTMLRVVASKPVTGDAAPATPGVARYIFLNTTADRRDITPTAPYTDYGIVSRVETHWFRTAAPLEGTTHRDFIVGQIMRYTAGGTAIGPMTVCWPEALNAQFARGTFVVVSNDSVHAEGIGNIPVLRATSVDNMLASTSAGTAKLLDGFVTENLSPVDEVTRQIGEIGTYNAAQGIMTFVGEHFTGINLLNRPNNYNFVAITGAPGAPTITRTMNNDNNADAGGANWWYGSLNNIPEASFPGNLATMAHLDVANRRNYEEIQRRITLDAVGGGLYAVIYRANDANSTILSITIVADFTGRIKSGLGVQSSFQGLLNAIDEIPAPYIFDDILDLMDGTTLLPVSVNAGNYVATKALEDMINEILDLLDALDDAGVIALFEAFVGEDLDDFIGDLETLLDDVEKIIAPHEASLLLPIISTAGGTLGTTTVPLGFITWGSFIIAAPTYAQIASAPATDVATYRNILSAIILALDVDPDSHFYKEMDIAVKAAQTTDVKPLAELITALKERRDDLDAAQAFNTAPRRALIAKATTPGLEASDLADVTTLDADWKALSAGAKLIAAERMIITASTIADMLTAVEGIQPKGLQAMFSAVGNTTGEWTKGGSNPLFAFTLEDNDWTIVYGVSGDEIPLGEVEDGAAIRAFLRLLGTNDRFKVNNTGAITEITLAAVAAGTLVLSADILAPTVEITGVGGQWTTMFGTAGNVVLKGAATADFNVVNLVYTSLTIDGEIRDLTGVDIDLTFAAATTIRDITADEVTLAKTAAGAVGIGTITAVDSVTVANSATADAITIARITNALLADDLIVILNATADGNIVVSAGATALEAKEVHVNTARNIPAAATGVVTLTGAVTADLLKIMGGRTVVTATRAGIDDIEIDIRETVKVTLSDATASDATTGPGYEIITFIGLAPLATETIDYTPALQVPGDVTGTAGALELTITYDEDNDVEVEFEISERLLTITLAGDNVPLVLDFEDVDNT